MLYDQVLPQPSRIIILQYLTECYVMGKLYNNYDYDDGGGSDIFTVLVHDLFKDSVSSSGHTLQRRMVR